VLGRGRIGSVAHPTLRSLARAGVVVAVVSAGLVGAASPPAHAWDAGDLDETFDGDGVVTVGGPAAGTNGFALALQPGGGVVLAGRLHDTDDDPIAARWHGQGSPDQFFVSGGGNVLRLGGDADASFSDVAAVGSRLALAGWVEETPGDRDLYLVRSTAGTLESGFGSGGIVTADLGGDDTASAVAVLADDRVVVVGTSVQGGERYGVVARFTAAGDLDPSFSGDGVWKTLHAQLTDLVVRPDGSLLAVGTDYTLTDNLQALAVQLEADGTPDTDWAGAGRAAFGTPENDELAAVALQPDGRAVVAGNVSLTSALLARLGTDGTLDTGYGVGGYRIDGYGSEATFSGLAVDGAGRAVAAGMRAVPGSSDSAALVARFTAGGAPDPTFGAAGTRYLEHRSALLLANYSAANDVAIDEAGQIVVGGFRPGETTTVGAVWRLHAAAGAPPVVNRLVAIPSFDKQHLKASKLKKIVGAAGGDDLATVQLAFNKADRQLLRDRHKCLWATKPGNRFKKFPATKAGKKYRCTVPGKWLAVSGLTSWSVKLSSRLEPGKYAFYARAGNSAGQWGDPSFVRIKLT
jgi:uncharacterized delta-60 repeat protein